MKKERKFEDICWDIFEKTGKIGPYLLYKILQREKEYYGEFDNNKSNRFEGNSLSR